MPVVRNTGSQREGRDGMLAFPSSRTAGLMTASFRLTSLHTQDPLRLPTHPAGVQAPVAAFLPHPSRSHQQTTSCRRRSSVHDRRPHHGYSRTHESARKATSSGPRTRSSSSARISSRRVGFHRRSSHIRRTSRVLLVRCGSRCLMRRRHRGSERRTR